LPLIDYCCVVWGNCSNEGLNRILKLQKRKARLILDQDPIAPSEPLFKQRLDQFGFSNLDLSQF
jgi:hypothetical protein